jgi:hypothetical protein
LFRQIISVGSRKLSKNPVNRRRRPSLFALIRPNLRSLNFLILLKDPKMKNLIAALIAGMFAVSAFAADAPASASAAASTDASASAPKAKKVKKAKKAKAASADASASAAAAPAASK